ncbi:MAG: DNA primase DnaG [archaeon]|nr:DNA primase DnaG [archaeon]
MNSIDPTTIKYMVKAKLSADGIIEKPDVVGAIFGQTEGLLGDELDLRDLQKSGRIGRIEVDVTSKNGKSEGIVYVSSSLDQVETAILASALETIDRVGPCKAGLKVLGIEDIRITKRQQVIERAKELLNDLIKQSKGKSADLTDSIRQSIQVEEITTYGKDHCPAGPNVKDSESIIVVEGRSDVLNLLKAGIKNAIAVEGTNIPETVQELSKEKVTTAFVDGDRGGELILRELFQVAEIDFVARAPRAHEVEELSMKQLTKCLHNKIPSDQYMEMNGIVSYGNGFEDEVRKNDEKPHRERELRERKSCFNEIVDKYEKKDEEIETDGTVEEPPKEFGNERSVEDTITEKKKVGKRKKDVVRQTKILSPEQQTYRDMLLDMASTHNAKVLNADGDVIHEVAVKNLVDLLKENSEGAATIVFDGVISQRVLDVSSSKNISVVVGTRKGNITKMPAGITIWTKEDLY